MHITFKPRGRLVMGVRRRWTIETSSDVLTCSVCGALVEDRETRVHAEWHYQQVSS